MFSYWEHQSFLQAADVCIIGSGIVGLNAAVELKTRYPQLLVRVIERGHLPTGASTKNAGFACFGSASELLADLKTQPKEEVWGLVARRYNGLLKLRARLGAEQIGFYQHGNYEIFTSQERGLYQNCSEHLDEFNQTFFDIFGVRDIFQPQPQKIADFGLAGVENLIWNAAEGQIHTGKMMKRLLLLAQSLGVEVYNRVSVRSVVDEGNRVALLCEDFPTLYCRKLLVATNGFARQLLPDLEVYPARNQVLVTEPIPNLQLRGCFHQDEGYLYFRDIDGRVLIGGGRNLDLANEATDQFGLTELIQSRLESVLAEHILPNQPFQIAHRWAGILGIGPIKKPIIKSVSDNVLAAVRMGGMGVAIGILVAEEAVEQLHF